MKKLLIGVQLLVLLLILTRVASLVGFVKKSDILPSAALTTSQALAQPPASSPATGTIPAALEKPLSGTSDDNLATERDLSAALLAKKNELDNRESALRAEEKRLLALRKEITDKIALLKSQEEKLTSVLDTVKASETKKYKEMAKVYESTPPAKAGKMMEQLDIKTAAGITMNMKKDKAGAVWGYISPQKAVEITKEITHASGKQQTQQ